ncbi:MAG: ImmA/IrrE family metallo-endopeptidase [Clostridium sp.]
MSDIFIELKKSFGDKYFEKLKQLKDIRATNNILKDEVINLINENLNKNELTIVIDIFLELKFLNKFSNDDLINLNEKIVCIFNETKNENVAYYLLGYVINNKLNYDEKRFERKFKKVNEEYKLGNEISQLIINNDDEKELAIMSWVGAHNPDELRIGDISINIFSVAENIRFNLNNDFYKKKLNDTLYNILNKCDKSIVGTDNILEFIIAIYQDSTFRNQDIVKKMQKLVSVSTSNYLEKLYIDIWETNRFNRLSDGSKYIDNAARGKLSQLDLDILNDYLNKTIKTNKKVNTINLKHGYSANDIINFTKININEKIDLEFLVRKLKIQYYEEENLNSNISGYSFKIKKYNKASIVMNNNYKGTKERRRFTLAHEIGHICTKIEGKGFSNDYIFKKTQNTKNEKESDVFAGELLLPQQVVDKFNDIDINYDRIENLAKKYEVSIEMACNRVVKSAKGSFAFILLYKNNEQYTMKSEGYCGAQKKLEEFTECVKEISTNHRKLYNKTFNYIVDVEIRGNYKYVLVNDRYSFR